MPRPPKTLLRDTYPHLRWEYSPRNGIDFDSLATTSHQKVYWICSLGHEYNSVVGSRTKGNAGCSVCNNKQVLPGFNDLATTSPDVARDWDYEKNGGLLPTQVTRASGKKVWWVCPSGHSWKASPHHRSKTSGCPQCSASRYVSVQEKEVADFVRSLFAEDEVITSYRGIPGVTEVDIYIPHLRVAVEFNGIYYHSSTFRDKYYHSRKVDSCEDQGIRLIQVWEDDWEMNRPIVEAMLRHKLGKSNQPKIAARKTSACFITTGEAKKFLREHHIQGFTGGSYYLALKYGDSICAVMVLFRQPDNVLRLERYATSAVVAGGQSKLLKYAEREIPDWEAMITFADREVSDGNLYEQSGWTVDKVLRPDYKYFVKGKRVHKFRYRLKRFRTDPELQWREGLSESQLAELNGIPRVWDSGKVRYRYERKQV